MLHRVGTLADLPPGTMRPAMLDRRAILVCRGASGDVYALRDRCPHQGAPLSSGSFGGTTVPSEPGRYAYGREHEIVRCPWHAYEFDVKTGCALFGEANVRVRTYRVVVEDGEILVDDGQPAR